jgi:hypothetical protein
VRVARKHISWYTKGRGLVGGGAFRDAVNRLETAAEQLALVRSFLGEQIDLRQAA